jgi:hypothetical protein
MGFVKDAMIGVGIISTRKLTKTPVVPDFVAAVESGNSIQVSIQLKDPDGNAVHRQVTMKCQVLKSTGIAATASEFRLSETGAGAEVSTTGNPVLIVTTSASGACVIAVHDQAGSYSGVAYLVVEPLNTFGSPGIVSITFA